MSRRKSSSSDGCLMYIIPLCIIFAPILWVLKILSENLVAILIAVFVIGLIIALIVIIKKVADKNAAIEAERQRNLAIVNSSEPSPKLVSVPSSRTFANKEEETINLKFREFLEQQNKVIRAKTHYDYLSDKARAFTALGRGEEAAQLSSAISLAQTALSEAQSKRISYDSKNISKFYRDNEIKNAFSAFASKLSGEKVDLIGDFIQAPFAKSVRIDGSSTLIFTPCCVFHYSSLNNFIKVYRYNDVSISKYISTELLKGHRASDDEIEHIGYRYETKDGRRDMRYSYENNPSYTFVYRGEITIKCGSVSYEQKFRNKSYTENFEKLFTAYLALVKGKYASVVKQILDGGSEFSQASSVETFLNQQAAAERLRAAEEMAKKAKADEERREREAIEEAKRRAERLEHEAREREEKRQADLRKNFTIVENVLTSWYGSDRHLTIPSGLVTEIGTAFRWKSSLETVEIPEGVSKIHSNAFHGTTSLRSVVIPSSVKEIGKEAFLGCSGLTEIVLPRGIKTIASKQFANCSSLKRITIPTSVKKIEAGAFSGCSSLQEIILPEGVVSIEDNAFSDCASLKNIKIPDSVVSFGEDVLSGCVSLEIVSLGAGVTKIPEASFIGHKKLKEIYISAGVSAIGDRAFKNCTSLQIVKRQAQTNKAASKGMAFEMLVSGGKSTTSVDDSLTHIGKSAFENCSALKAFDFTNGLVSIGEYAFCNCRNISSVVLPASLKSLDKGAFLGCKSLSSVDGIEAVSWQKKYAFVGTPWLSEQGDSDFVIFDDHLEAYVGTDENVEIPETVKTIGCHAFDGNRHISTVIVPEGVRVIDELAFANCSKLKSVQIADSVEKIEDNAFENDDNFIIQCSRGSAASAFRIRNKIPGEYVAKTKAPAQIERTSPRKRTEPILDGLSGLSEEEYRIIMEMRREKLAAKKQQEQASVAVPETIEYKIVDFDSTKVSIKLQEDSRKITNNIFNLRFIQNEVVGSDKETAEYETFVIDANGQIISNVLNIIADKSGGDLSYKVTYTLSSQSKFSKDEAYYVALRYKGATNELVSKTQYKIVIEFASDFDF